MSTLYIVVGMLVVVSAIGVVASRRRKTADIDQVSENVLNRIRTEYR